MVEHIDKVYRYSLKAKGTNLLIQKLLELETIGSCVIQIVQLLAGICLWGCRGPPATTPTCRIREAIGPVHPWQALYAGVRFDDGVITLVTRLLVIDFEECIHSPMLLVLHWFCWGFLRFSSLLPLLYMAHNLQEKSLTTLILAKVGKPFIYMST